MVCSTSVSVLPGTPERSLVPGTSSSRPWDPLRDRRDRPVPHQDLLRRRWPRRRPCVSAVVSSAETSLKLGKRRVKSMYPCRGNHHRGRQDGTNLNYGNTVQCFPLIVTTDIVTNCLLWQFLFTIEEPKWQISTVKSSLIVTIGYCDTFALSQLCHNNRQALYIQWNYYINTLQVKFRREVY